MNNIFVQEIISYILKVKRNQKMMVEEAPDEPVYTGVPLDEPPENHEAPDEAVYTGVPIDEPPENHEKQPAPSGVITGRAEKIAWLAVILTAALYLVTSLAMLIIPTPRLYDSGDLYIPDYAGSISVTGSRAKSHEVVA